MAAASTWGLSWLTGAAAEEPVPEPLEFATHWLVLLTTASDGVDAKIKFQQKEVRRVLATTLIRDAPGRPSVLQACTVEVDASSPETHEQVAFLRGLCGEGVSFPQLFLVPRTAEAAETSLKLAKLAAEESGDSVASCFRPVAITNLEQAVPLFPAGSGSHMEQFMALAEEDGARQGLKELLSPATGAATPNVWTSRVEDGKVWHVNTALFIPPGSSSTRAEPTCTVSGGRIDPRLGTKNRRLTAPPHVEGSLWARVALDDGEVIWENRRTRETLADAAMTDALKALHIDAVAPAPSSCAVM
ncbi:hypothetical protein FNF27_04411 [Cafeteria roenbergensis]|uniref:Uncharacterized protein n=1 Tax=Cafeteria roenbergensis TaxID=33653 RepID=A0A5A8EE11_CAFRO|nr:hypothetical protein FNF28_06489 [Cafeteria roenbergensis]KAA0160777.1 hypothetical protein FNF31_04160 [Cafeteria roenbergensis]KAA0174190.1 hypothetical protein FNF27_04411 [Cafeteria roenbergensis]